MEPLEPYLAERLGITPGFISSIHAETDWGFTIKVQALIEASINKLLENRLNAPELSDIIAILPTGEKQTGKLQMLKALGVIHPDHKKFVESMSRLRNQYAHNISNIHKSLIDCCKECSADKEDLERSIKKQIVAMCTGIKPIKLPLPAAEYVDQDFRRALFIGATIVVCACAFWDSPMKVSSAG